ncbi:MAG: hypothetical protein FGM32_08395 [Candidatus Kapabacteria bacterium]|nr:hypothetical protein [Candidatus Kapabacteria bacterium]
MYLVAFLLSTMLVCAQSQDVVISRTALQTCSVRLVPRGGEKPQVDLFFVRVRSAKRGADTSITPIRQINGAGALIDVVGRTPDSTGVILALNSDTAQLLKEYAHVRHVVVGATSDGTYTIADVDGRTMESLTDIVKGARMVHRGENSLPIANLSKVDLKSEPYNQSLSTAAFAVAGVERLIPMWQLFRSSSGAENILTYGFDDEMQPTVQVVQIGAGRLRRLIFQRGAIVGLSPEGSNSPSVRVFDESRDSGRYARAIRYAWNGSVLDNSVESRYVPQIMAILSACVIPPKRFAPFPLTARLTRAVRLGFSPGAEGCSSSRHDSYSWPFDKPLEAATPCEILATVNDAADAAWHFVAVRVQNDPAVRRLFGDHGTSDSEQILTGGWVPATALEALGLPGVDGVQ